MSDTSGIVDVSWGSRALYWLGWILSRSVWGPWGSFCTQGDRWRGRSRWQRTS